MPNWDHFTQEELQCRCDYSDCDGGEMSPTFMVRLIELRKFLGFPLLVTSAFRCEKHNADIGGRSNSYHRRGCAVDIAIDRDKAYQVVAAARSFGMKGVGVRQVGEKRFIHLDNRQQTDVSFWSY